MNKFIVAATKGVQGT